MVRGWSRTWLCLPRLFTLQRLWDRKLLIPTQSVAYSSCFSHLRLSVPSQTTVTDHNGMHCFRNFSMACSNFDERSNISWWKCFILDMKHQYWHSLSGICPVILRPVCLLPRLHGCLVSWWRFMHSFLHSPVSGSPCLMLIHVNVVLLDLFASAMLILLPLRHESYWW